MQLELSFATGEDSLSVRRFSVHEQFSTLFDVAIWAVSPDEDLDLASLVGRPATFRMTTGLAHATGRGMRVFSGIVRHAEQMQAESTGLSTYFLRIAPQMYRLTQRRNHRIFQHARITEIADQILRGWHVPHAFRLDQAAYPRLTYRVQYGETDFAFLSRLLEEAGITFGFEVDEDDEMRVVLWQRPDQGELRKGAPLRYVDHPNEAAENEFVTRMRIAHGVRPGHVTLRDYDFRRPDFPLLGTSPSARPPDHVYEQYHYTPGAFVVAGGTGHDDRHDDKVGEALATFAFEGERSSKRIVSFDTNAVELAPGHVLTIDGHPRSELASDRRLLVTEVVMDGTHDGPFTMSVEAVFIDTAYRPPRRTRKPVVHGLQSATVVGPKGEEIHTDEHGRVRVQFPWDREGSHDERSSCWLRVSHGWAGAGQGIVALPRVGQEVLVGFLEGDPDQPVVVGRVYNAKSPLPYRLPEQRTVSTWKSASSPGGVGFNEIRFEDAKGRELVSMQAERDLSKLVKVNETETTGACRTITVGGNRTATIGASDTIVVGMSQAVTVKPPPDYPADKTPTGTTMQHERIELTTGGASMVMEGGSVAMTAADIHLAAGKIQLEAGLIILSGATVQIVGGLLESHNGIIQLASKGVTTIDAGGDVAINGAYIRLNC